MSAKSIGTIQWLLESKTTYKINNQVNDNPIWVAWKLSTSSYNRCIKAKVGDVITNGFTCYDNYDGKYKETLADLAHEHKSIRYYI
jgi:hypothetical protein